MKIENTNAFSEFDTDDEELAKLCDVVEKAEGVKKEEDVVEGMKTEGLMMEAPRPLQTTNVRTPENSLRSWPPRPILGGNNT